MKDEQKIQWLIGVCIILFLLLVFSISAGVSISRKTVELQKQIDYNNKKVEDQKSRMFKFIKLFEDLKIGPERKMSNDKLNCLIDNLSKKGLIFDAAYSFLLAITGIFTMYQTVNNTKEGKPIPSQEAATKLMKMLNDENQKDDMEEISKICELDN
jgi:hypothetical protein